MEAAIRINTDNLTGEIIEGIKKMFPYKTVEISIQPADETEYILRDPFGGIGKPEPLRYHFAGCWSRPFQFPF